VCHIHTVCRWFYFIELLLGLNMLRFKLFPIKLRLKSRSGSVRFSARSLIRNFRVRTVEDKRWTNFREPSNNLLSIYLLTYCCEMCWCVRRVKMCRWESGCRPSNPTTLMYVLSVTLYRSVSSHFDSNMSPICLINLWTFFHIP